MLASCSRTLVAGMHVSIQLALMGSDEPCRLYCSAKVQALLKAVSCRRDLTRPVYNTQPGLAGTVVSCLVYYS